MKVLHAHALLLLIVLVAFQVRLYRITHPLLDWHSWRQADTASVTREYVKRGIDLLHPRYHDLSDIPNGLDNTKEGYRMVEFPFINAGIASVLRSFPELPLVTVSRLVSVLFSLGTLLSLFFLSRELAGKKTAYVTAITFALLPYAIFYSRAILPEPAMLFFSTFSLLAFHMWLKTQKFSWYGLSLFGLTLALLLKPFILFLAPVYVALLWYHKQLKLARLPSLIVFGALAVAPVLWWRNWITQFPEGIPGSDWLYNGNGIRFRPAWFRWLGYERLTKLILGYAGFIFLPFGLLSQKMLAHKHIAVYWAWWLGMGAYLAVFATGNVQHDYYQNLLLPIVCLTVGEGVSALYQLIKKFGNKFRLAPSSAHFVSAGVVSLIYLLMLYFSWQEVKGYFNVNLWERAKAGQVADQLLPPEAKVIAPQSGDTAFLFQTNRTGWPISLGIEDKINKGATHYVTATFDDEAKRLEEQYFIVAKTDEYLILDLRREKDRP